MTNALVPAPRSCPALDLGAFADALRKAAAEPAVWRWWTDTILLQQRQASPAPRMGEQEPRQPNADQQFLSENRNTWYTPTPAEAEEGLAAI